MRDRDPELVDGLTVLMVDLLIGLADCHQLKPLGIALAEHSEEELA